MAFETCTVTGKIFTVDGNVAPNEYINFRLKNVGAKAGNDVAVRSTHTIQTDANGEFSTTLYVNGDSSVASVYEISLPSGEFVEVIIPDDTTSIDLDSLIANNQVVSNSPPLFDAYNEAIKRANQTGTQTLSTISDAGTMASQNADSVAITGGSISGITDLAIADGGTGASSWGDARTNLNLGTAQNVTFNSVTQTNALSTAKAVVSGDGTITSANVNKLISVQGDGTVKNSTYSVETTALSNGTTTVPNSNVVYEALNQSNAGGQPLSGLSFDATTDYLSLADNAALDVGTGDFSLGFWLRLEDIVSTNQSIVEKYISSQGYRVIYASATGRLQLVFWSGTDTPYTAVGNGLLADGKWHFVCLVADRSGNLTTYLDGAQHNTTDISGQSSTDLDNTTSFRVGGSPVALESLSEGSVAGYVFLTKDLLTDAEVSEIFYDPTRAKDLDNLSVCLDLSNSPKNGILDRSSNAFAVTENGTVTYDDDRDKYQSPGGVLDDLNTLGAPTADGEIIVATGAGAFAYESGETARTSLGLTIGTDVQAHDAKLDSFSALSGGSDNLSYFTGSDTLDQTAFTSFARTLLDDTDASTARTTLGLGSAAVANLLDEDDMASNSATAAPSQQSVKTYTDTGVRLRTPLPYATFDGSTGAMVVPLAMSDAFFRSSNTLSVLINIADGNPAANTVLLGSGSGPRRHWLTLLSTGELSMQLGNGTTANGFVSTVPVFSNGETGWQWLTVRYDSTANDLYFYLDAVQIGNSVDTSSVDMTALASFNVDYAFGAYNNGGTLASYTNCSIAQVVVHNSALSTADITANFGNGGNVDIPSASAYWAFESGIGYQVIDYGSNNYDGLLQTSGVTWSHPKTSGSVRDFNLDANGSAAYVGSSSRDVLPANAIITRAVIKNNDASNIAVGALDINRYDGSNRATIGDNAHQIDAGDGAVIFPDATQDLADRRIEIPNNSDAGMDDFDIIVNYEEIA